MTEPTITFKFLGHTERNGIMIESHTIDRYLIEVTCAHKEQVEVLEVEPKHLLSAQSMKRLLLNRCMFYSTTQKRHTETIVAMFDEQDAKAR